MTITINDESKTLTDAATLSELLDSLELVEQKGIAVAVNELVVTRTTWQNYNLRDTDRVTIIQATQGG